MKILIILPRIAAGELTCTIEFMLAMLTIVPHPITARNTIESQKFVETAKKMINAEKTM